jgi:hypothetical protein
VCVMDAGTGEATAGWQTMREGVVVQSSRPGLPVVGRGGPPPSLPLPEEFIVGALSGPGLGIAVRGGLGRVRISHFRLVLALARPGVEE